MDKQNLKSDDKQLEQLPQALVEALRGADTSLAVIDPHTDRRVLAEAREHFAARPERLRPVRTRWAVAAAAAVIVAAFLVVRPLELLQPPRGGADDIDGSGQVDVLDAFALARMSVSDESIGDREINALLGRIVALDNTGRL